MHAVTWPLSPTSQASVEPMTMDAKRSRVVAKAFLGTLQQAILTLYL